MMFLILSVLKNNKGFYETTEKVYKDYCKT